MNDTHTYTVALDVMGADRGVATIVEGGLLAAQKIGSSVHVALVGSEEKIRAALSAVQNVPTNVSVHHAETEVTMKMAATDGAKMRDSSISVGIQMVKRREADAFVSPGNTGAVMATSLLTLGRIEGVSRPAITAVFPTSTGRPTVTLDVGANADCKPMHLSQFAVMGSVYASVRFNLDAPRVGLLSIGEERSKGNELIFDALELLRESSINFVGNVEGRDILSGTVDVVVTDGFTGNILLKFAESVQPLLMTRIQRQVQTNLFSRIGVLMMLPFFRRLKGSFDYSEFGGAPLLGVDGIVMICHGSSNAKAICNAIIAAHDMASKKTIERIHDELVTNHFGKSNGSKAKSTDNRDRVVYATTADDQR